MHAALCEDDGVTIGAAACKSLRRYPFLWAKRALWLWFAPFLH